MKHFMPSDSDDSRERETWEKKVARGEVKVIDSIVTWIDILGFQNRLNSCGWDLKNAASSGIFSALNSIYSVGAKPNVTLLNGTADASERSLVLNDGIARALDIEDYRKVYPIPFLFFLRDILLAHLFCVRTAVRAGFPGIRAVVAVGQRAQYSPELRTGASHVYYTNQPRDPEIRKLLNLSLTISPAHFQMNTAFSLAYAVERLGSKAGLAINGIYFVESATDFILKVLNYHFVVVKSGDDNKLWEVTVGNTDHPYIKFRFQKHHKRVKALGAQIAVHQCLGYIAYEALENEVVNVNFSKLCPSHAVS